MTIILDGTNGITSPGETLTDTQILAAGTTTIAPLKFQAGTNLTTATAGVMGYDGKVFYATPQGTQRGVLPAPQFFRLDSGLAGANATGAQNMLGVGVTLSASTVYAFEIVVALSKTAGTTSHTISLGFGGTASLNNIFWEFAGDYGVSQSFTAANFSSGYAASVTPVVTTNAITNATQYYWMVIKGTVSINAGGTFIPQYSLSAAPGGAYTTVTGSNMSIYPIGAAGANTNVGTWA